jgi:hypothetical protein
MSATEGTPQAPPPAPGVPRRAGKGYVVSFGEDRMCSSPGCSTRLSRYNDKSMCWAHA